MSRILFLANIPAPYRVDFFNEWGKYCNLTVAFERRYADDRNSDWLSKKAINFKAVYLNGLKIGSDSAICVDIIKLISKESFDFVIIGVYSEPTSIILIEYMNHKKIPYIISMDGAICHEERNYSYYLKKHLLRNPICFISPSKECDKYIRRYNSSTKIYRYPFTSVCNNDIITSLISKKEKEIIRKKLGMNYQNIVISVGQLIFRKGMDVLIDASRMLKNNTGVYIIGGKPSNEYVKMIKNDSNVHFVDFKTKEELSEYYKAADIFVLATREDIWGLVINEAMAHGLPIITTNRCLAGLELVKEGKNGFIININDSIDLSKKINEILSSNKYEQMQQNSLNIIREYTIENMAIVHNNIVNKIQKGEL